MKKEIIPISVQKYRKTLYYQPISRKFILNIRKRIELLFFLSTFELRYKKLIQKDRLIWKIEV